MLIVGVDVGGTFTDLIALDPARGWFSTAKSPEHHFRPIYRVRRGSCVRRRAFRRHRETLVHGTTVATNAVSERRGCRGLITTRGFRDVLELCRRTRPNLYGLTGVLGPIVPRELRVEVTERMDVEGRVVTPLAESEIAAVARTLLERGAEAVVIHFLHSHRECGA